MGTEIDHANQHLQIVWGNIQHNERLRNASFSLYLIISGFFFALLKTDTILLPHTQVIFYSSIFVWTIGILNLWSLTRFTEMIGRDARIVRHLLDRLAELDDGNAQAWSEYKRYYRSFDSKKVNKWGSVNSCLTASVSIIATVVLAIGGWASGYFDSYQIGMLFLLVLLVNKEAVIVFKRCWGVEIEQIEKEANDRQGVPGVRRSRSPRGSC